MKFEAQLHGAKLEEPVLTTEQSSPKNDMSFKDPSAYENMSKEEKDKLTDQMLGKWKSWSKDALK